MGDYGSGETQGLSAASELQAAEVDSVPQLTPAVQRFQSCRWRKAADGGVPEHCTHRDVQPMAGAAAFNPEAWCPDCSLYKVRRNPRKQRPEPISDDRERS